MSIKIYDELEQGTPEWLQARCGLLTASEVCKIMSAKTLKVSASEGFRTHVFDTAAERINGFISGDGFQSFAMARGHEDEVWARDIYSENYAPIKEVGFITNDDWGFPIGFSPDGLVGEDGLVECKSRAPKYQARTIVLDVVPAEYLLQIHTGMLVSGRKWCDFISYSGGMPMYVRRVQRDEEWCKAIIAAAAVFEAAVNQHVDAFKANVKKLELVPTERREEEEELTF